MIMIGHCCHCAGTDDVWIASIPFVDPQGDDNWYACQKNHGADFREYWHENRYDQSHPTGGGGHLNWDPVRHGANHIGYGFEWRYQGFHSTNVSEDPYQPPIKVTTKITDTQFAQSNVNAFGYAHDRDNAGTQINPLTHLMIHYGRPVISRDAEFDDHWFGPFPKVDPHQYEMLTYPSSMFNDSLTSSMESVWSDQVQAAAVEICGYPEAVPGDFLVGMLPANHWTKPKGIKKIGIRLGLSDNGYYNHRTIDTSLFAIGADYHVGNPGENPLHWTIYNYPYYSTYDSSPLVKTWFRNTFMRNYNVGTPMYDSIGVRYKYRVYLGDLEITAKPLEEQQWLHPRWQPAGGDLAMHRQELDISIPDDWEYQKVDLSVQLFFENNTARNNSPTASTEYFAMCFGQNGLGDWIWPGIDVVYDLTHDVRKTHNVTVQGLPGLTEGRILPLSGRLAAREKREVTGREAHYYTSAISDELVRGTFSGPDHSVDIVTGFFPSGNNHLAEDLLITDNVDRSHDPTRHRPFVHSTHDAKKKGPPCVHMSRAVPPLMQTFGHWTGVPTEDDDWTSQVFVERLRNTNVDVADNFVPLESGVSSREIIVTPET